MAVVRFLHLLKLQGFVQLLSLLLLHLGLRALEPTNGHCAGTVRGVFVAEWCLGGSTIPEASFVALISGEPWFGALIGSLSVN